MAAGDLAGAAAVVGLVILFLGALWSTLRYARLPRRAYATSSGGRDNAVRVVAVALIVVAGLLAGARSASATIIVAVQTTDGAVVCADKMRIGGLDDPKAVSTTVKVRQVRYQDCCGRCRQLVCQQVHGTVDLG